MDFSFHFAAWDLNSVFWIAFFTLLPGLLIVSVAFGGPLGFIVIVGLLFGGPLLYRKVVLRRRILRAQS